MQFNESRRWLTDAGLMMAGIFAALAATDPNFGARTEAKWVAIVLFGLMIWRARRHWRLRR